MLPHLYFGLVDQFLELTLKKKYQKKRKKSLIEFGSQQPAQVAVFQNTIFFS